MERRIMQIEEAARLSLELKNIFLSLSDGDPTMMVQRILRYYNLAASYYL